MRRILPLLATGCAVIACGSPTTAPSVAPSSSAGAEFRSADCNGVDDADVATAAGGTLFTRVVLNDAGCFWQENTAIGEVELGMGLSTWWYRGSDLDAERTLERNTGRSITEVEVNGNKGFEARDDNACSVYLAKGGDVITWSVQTGNPGKLPDLCSITGTLAQLSQDRLN